MTTTTKRAPPFLRGGFFFFIFRETMQCEEQSFRRHIESAGIDVDEHRLPTAQFDHVGCSNPGITRYCDQVARPDVQSQHCEMQSRSSIGDGNRMANPGNMRDLLLELTHPGPLNQ